MHAQHADDRFLDRRFVSVIGTMAMTAAAIIGLTFRSARKRFFLSWDAMTIVALYSLTAFLLFKGV